MEKLNYKKISVNSFILGLVLGLVYVLILIFNESRNHSSLKISQNLPFIILLMVFNGLFYSLFSFLFVYLRNKFNNFLKWVLPTFLVILSLVIYIFLVTLLTIGFLISLTGF